MLGRLHLVSIWSRNIASVNLQAELDMERFSVISARSSISRILSFLLYSKYSPPEIRTRLAFQCVLFCSFLLEILNMTNYVYHTHLLASFTATPGLTIEWWYLRQDMELRSKLRLKMGQIDPMTKKHSRFIIMNAMASQITSVSIVYSKVCSGADQRKNQSSASLVFVRGIHRWPVNSLHERPVT